MTILERLKPAILIREVDASQTMPQTALASKSASRTASRRRCGSPQPRGKAPRCLSVKRLAISASR